MQLYNVISINSWLCDPAEKGPQVRGIDVVGREAFDGGLVLHRLRAQAEVPASLLAR